ncbi:MAG: hypothetical protein IPM24_11705 [Bryobacterales bacterium]|nr:hypothetical protein [Bryobacterales bacterium]
MNNTQAPAASLAALLLLLASSANAGQTGLWTQDSYEAFSKAVTSGVSLASDGSVTLAPSFRELFDSSSAYLWSAALDAKGILYAGGGPPARLYRVTPDGQSAVWAEFDTLQVQAVAVDPQGRVYAATSPEGKVYRITAQNQPEVFYEPGSRYIWSLAFGPNGDLFVATGDGGEVHRVTAAGQGSIFFRTEETHARSLAVDKQGNLIVGTEPGGLVIRVTPSGEGFVLHQMSRKEVTALAVDGHGRVIAAAVGAKGQPVLVPPAPAPHPATPQAATMARVQTAPAVQPQPAAPAAPQVRGGSEVVRIEPDGYPRLLWSDGQELVYALAADTNHRIYAGTGNQGAIYRLDAPNRHTLLLKAPPTQVTALVAAPDGSFHAATGNAGKIFHLGPGLATEGSIESEPLDAGLFSRWGWLRFQGNGGAIVLETRSGNLDQPQKNWSPWAEAARTPDGGSIKSPAARFLQWRATLRPGAGDAPVLRAVETAYRQRNAAPVVNAVEATPPNFRFPAPSSPSAAVQTLTLPPLGKPRPAKAARSEPAFPTLQHAKGWIAARWSALDPNDDSLQFRLEIRQPGQAVWTTLKDSIRENYLSWDSTSFPDGLYQLRVTASDAPDNPPAEALETLLESEVFLIDNTPPEIRGLKMERRGGKLHASWTAVDERGTVERAEYSLNGGEWLVAGPREGVSSARSLTYELELDAAPGEATLAVRVEDQAENRGSASVTVR